MQTKTFTSQSQQGSHVVTYYEYGNPHKEALLCVHGLLGNGRNFDWLAEALGEHYRIIAIDLPGRGKSDCLGHDKEYALPQYIHDITVLLEHEAIRRVHWVGTSLGGLLGILFAANPFSGIASLVLNDVGPALPQLTIDKMAERFTDYPIFKALDEAKAYLKQFYSSYQPLPEPMWDALTQTSIWSALEGRYTLAYDPSILENVKRASQLSLNLELWPWWHLIQCPILVMHGETSTVLTQDTLTRMQTAQPTMELRSFSGVGHPLSLMVSEHLQVVKEWLGRISA